jgi:UDP-2,3-diacylglucosamine pyrophosphatase LpxH
MLVIISDLHLGDGTTAESIPASAFHLFAKRLRQDAHFASLQNGRYRPIEELDVLLMGDILDPIHSTKWLFPTPGNEEYVRVGDEELIRITEPGERNYIRPWSDTNDPRFASKLLEVTRAILEHNKEGLGVLRKLSTGEYIDFDSVDSSGGRVYSSQEKIRIRVRFHYMVGNHDWYYHLEGEAFDCIRQEIIDAMGLSNTSSPFPFDLGKFNPNSLWKADESPDIERLFREYKVFGRHGDCYDSFNFDSEKGRNYPTLGDAFTMEVCNRYPEELKRRSELNQEVVNNMRHITNIRPALATPLWVTGQLRKLTMENKLKVAREAELKGIWDELADNFLHLSLVREADKAFEFDIVNKMQLAIKISNAISFETIDNLVFRLQNKRTAASDRSFARYALQEPAFLDNSARYIVYGHTHHHETIPLDYDDVGGNQMYFNSGTWHTYFDLARKDPTEKKFIPYKALTYITFYKDNEHDERHFETWSGAYA